MLFIFSGIDRVVGSTNESDPSLKITFLAFRARMKQSPVAYKARTHTHTHSILVVLFKANLHLGG